MKVLLSLAALMIAPCIFAHDDEPNLRLADVGSFQVSSSLIQPSETHLTLSMTEAPFISALQKLGKKIDQNNYSNVIGSHIVITSATIKGSTVYAVNLSFRYTEPCASTRLEFQTLCDLWESDEPPAIFDNPEAASLYVKKAITSAADAFAVKFGRH